MTDYPVPPRADGDGALLSAYLAGDLDDTAVVDLERRLAADPQLAAQLDGVAETLARLRRLDDVTPPEGYAERLSARLDTERQSQGTVVPIHAEPAARTHRPSSPRQRTWGPGHEPRRRTWGPGREPRRRTWMALGSVAAALVGVVVLGFGIVSLSAGGANQAADDSGAAQDAAGTDVTALQAPAATEGEERAPEAAETAASGADDAAETATQAAGAAGPLILDDLTVIDRPAQLALIFGDVAADDIPELSIPSAAASRRALRDAEPLDSGADPAACIDELSGSATIVRVQSVIFDGQPALAYVLTDEAGSSQVQVRALPNCEALAGAALDS